MIKEDLFMALYEHRYSCGHAQRYLLHTAPPDAKAELSRHGYYQDQKPCADCAARAYDTVEDD